MSVSLQEFYRGKKVFLTGHTGFKGAWLSLWLRSLGADVTGFSLPPSATRPSLHWLLGEAEDAHCVYGDVNDYAALQYALARSGADIVLHMAAQALVRPSYSDPVATYRTNVMGSVHLFEAVRTAGHSIRAVVNVTTDKCYENTGALARPFLESDPLGGYDPYSSSKAASELVTSGYRQSFFSAPGGATHLASARAGNVIGGGDFSVDRIIPDLIFAAMEGRAVTMRSPNAIRPWQHVLDALHGYLLLAQRLYEQGAPFAQAYNFGPRDEFLCVRDLTDRLIAAMGQGEYSIDPAGADLHEAAVLRLDAALARDTLGWRPAFDVDEAVDATAQWYRTFMIGSANIKDYTLSQIHRYMEKL